VNGQAVALRPGERLLFDGDAVEVVALDGVSVTIRNDRTGRFAVMNLPRPVTGARSTVAQQPLAVESVGIVLASLTGDHNPPGMDHGGRGTTTCWRQLATHLRTDLALDALEMAIWRSAE
jgi:hypothetical protein